MAIPNLPNITPAGASAIIAAADRATLDALAKRQEAERKRREEELRRQQIAESRLRALKTQQLR